tara:strand:+ start:29304 stop:30287 length:984 start_codon:yes stop_codon:yes gene_type:complete
MITEKSQFVHGYPVAASTDSAEHSVFVDAVVESRDTPTTTTAQIPMAQPPIVDRGQLPQAEPFRLEGGGDGDIPPSSSVLQKRLSRPPPAPSSLPSFAFNDDGPASPPTTRAVLSPLPEANRMYAGHTPLFPPTARSPTQEAQEPDDYFGQIAAAARKQAAKDDNTGTPDADEGLQGALTLPANPVDGTDEHIELEELDKVLSKIARQQAVLRGDGEDEDELNSIPERKQMQKQKQRAESESSANAKADPSALAGPGIQAPAPQIKRDSKVDSSEANDDGQPLSQTTSADSRKPKTYVRDGIVFKADTTNFELPWGVPRKKFHRGSI